MSKASNWVAALRQRPVFFVGQRLMAEVGSEGGVVFIREYLEPQHVPAFIAWLRETFVDAP